MINIVLVEPEIPQNAGNIIRTCAATGVKLFMVKPLSFEVSDKHFKRAGLDYFDMANVEIIDSFPELVKNNPNSNFYYASTKAKKDYSEICYPDDCFLVFGKESYGLSENILKNNYENCIRIPMRENCRSLNLSNSVAIVLYEVLRQSDFKGLNKVGELTGRIEKDWKMI